MTIQFITNPIDEKDRQQLSGISDSIKPAHSSSNRMSDAVFLRRFTLALMGQYYTSSRPSPVRTQLKRVGQRMMESEKPFSLMQERKTGISKVAPHFALPNQAKKRPELMKPPEMRHPPVAEQFPIEAQPQTIISAQPPMAISVHPLLSRAPSPVQGLEEDSPDYMQPRNLVEELNEKQDSITQEVPLPQAEEAQLPQLQELPAPEEIAPPLPETAPAMEIKQASKASLNGKEEQELENFFSEIPKPAKKDVLPEDVLNIPKPD